MKALVTGASGFIGGAVAQALLAKGVEVRALLRAGTSPNVADPQRVEPAHGDLRDADSVYAAAAGCGAIFHVGGLYSFEAAPEELHAINVGGTRHVIDAARASGARLVFTSSVSTIGGVRDAGIPDQTQDACARPGPTRRARPQPRCSSAPRSTRPRRGDRQPTFPVGRGDVKPTPTGRVIRDFLAGRIRRTSIPECVSSTSTTSPRGTCSRSCAASAARATSWAMRTCVCARSSTSSRGSPAASPRGCACRTRFALGLAHVDALISGRATAHARPARGRAQRARAALREHARAVRELGLPQTPVRAQRSRRRCVGSSSGARTRPYPEGDKPHDRRSPRARPRDRPRDRSGERRDRARAGLVSSRAVRRRLLVGRA